MIYEPVILNMIGSGVICPWCGRDAIEMLVWGYDGDHPPDYEITFDCERTEYVNLGDEEYTEALGDCKPWDAVTRATALENAITELLNTKDD